MQILIIGNGGREHAIAWKVAQSNKINKVWVAPGNAGTALESKCENVAIDSSDIEKLAHFAQQKKIDLTIVGPETPLAFGIVDVFNEAGLNIFGPTKKAAQLESSKAYCKDFMKKYGIPTAQYATFKTKQAALDYLETQTFPVVIKASGLAAGKGVIIAENQQQANDTVISMLEEDSFGNAGHEIVIEEFLSGEELSFIVMADGEHVLPLATSQDHKRRDNGDQGPNTGGMGAYSPFPRMNTELESKIMQQVIQPTIAALRAENAPYTGFLYAGLMITPEGDINVLEFNCRLGDPETQPLLMRLQSDLTDLCFAALKNQLNKVAAKWDPRVALSVVLAAGGYPFNYQKGDVIEGLNHASPDTKIFHAGTTQSNGKIVTNGGRVLAATALGENVQAAQQKAYALAKTITWPHCYYRTDIGYRATNL